MAEYSIPDIIVVKPGDNIPMVHLGLNRDAFCRISCTYKNLRTNEVKTEVYDSDVKDLTAAYNYWRGEHWHELFDPFSIKIESIDIQMIPR